MTVVGSPRRDGPLRVNRLPLNAHARYLLDSALRRGKTRALGANNCLRILDSPISRPHALPQPSSSRRSGYSRRSRQRCTTLTSSSSVLKHTLGATRRFQLAHDAQVERPLKARDSWRIGVSWANSIPADNDSDEGIRRPRKAWISLHASLYYRNQVGNGVSPGPIGVSVKQDRAANELRIVDRRREELTDHNRREKAV